MSGQGMGPGLSCPAFLLSEPQMCEQHPLGAPPEPQCQVWPEPPPGWMGRGGGHGPFRYGPGHRDQSQGLGRSGQPWAVPAGVRVGE